MSESRNEFRIEVTGLDLAEDDRKRIEKKILQAALAEMATIDLKGDLLISDLAEELKSVVHGNIGGKALKFGRVNNGSVDR